MTGRTRAVAFTEALALIRAHKDWTDEQLANRLGLHQSEVRHVIPQARLQVQRDQPDQAIVSSTGQWTPAA
jgi:hypothetical protein